VSDLSDPRLTGRTQRQNRKCLGKNGLSLTVRLSDLSDLKKRYRENDVRKNDRTEECKEALFTVIEEMYSHRQAALIAEKRALKLVVNAFFDWRESDASARIVKTHDGDSKTILTTKQLAERLNYSTRTIQQLKTEGLPHIGEGRATRFEIGAVVDWLKRHRKTVAAHGLRVVK